MGKDEGSGQGRNEGEEQELEDVKSVKELKNIKGVGEMDGVSGRGFQLNNLFQLRLDTQTLWCVIAVRNH